MLEFERVCVVATRKRIFGMQQQQIKESYLASDKVLNTKILDGLSNRVLHEGVNATA